MRFLSENGRLGFRFPWKALGLGLVFLGGCGSPAPPQPGPAARHLVLITLDTVRADRLGCYGYPRAGTPHLDRIAREGVRVERAYAQVPLTLPSHTSILTGLFPPHHGIHINGQTSMPPSVETLAQRLSRAGFFTAAAVGGYPVAARFPVSRGFQRFDDRLVDSKNPEALERDAGLVVRAALDLVRERGGKPLFLWVHFFDPHDPYEPPSPFKESFRTDPYQGEIARVDAALGDLLDGLRQSLGNEPFLLVVVGDHGEALGEHGEDTHGFFVYEGTLRVPLLFSGPRVPSGKVVSGPAQTVDIVPTVFSLLGLPLLKDLDGTVLDWNPGGETNARRVFAESELPFRNYGWAPLHTAIDGIHKYIQAPRPELFDLGQDPNETNNLVGSEKKRAEDLSGWLKPLSGKLGTDDQTTILDPRLVSLGYVSASPDPASGANLTDPKDKIGVYQRFQRASRALEGGKPTEALPLLDELLKTEDTPGLRFQRATAFRMAGKLDRAEAELNLLARKDPQFLGLDLERGRIAIAKGRYPEAHAFFDKHLEKVPESAEALMFRGACQEMMGKALEAERDYRQALDLNPGFSSASLRLVGLLIQTGRVAAAKNLLSVHLVHHPEDPMAKGLLNELP